MVVAVDGNRVPAAGFETADLVVGHRQVGRPVDGDRIVVPEDDELAELQVPGERDRLVADAFHEAAVAGNRIGPVIDHIVAEARGQHPFRQRHADGVGDALPERPRGRLDAGGVAELGMARGLRTQLPEVRQLLDGHAGIAGEIEQRVEQHGAVPGGEHEAVAVGPARIGGIEAQVFGEEHGRDVGHAHRHSGVARVRLLHRVHGQDADGVRHIAAAGRRFRIRHAP